MEMMKVGSCDASSCSYNKDNHCHALAITMKNASKVSCSTFFEGDAKGNGNGNDAGIGACTESDCDFNKGLECTYSEGIEVALNGDHAECISCNS